MARGPLFFFGALSSVFLSMLLHFASYPDVDLFDMLASNMVATWLTVAIAVLMFYLFPDVEPRSPRQAPAKDAPAGATRRCSGPRWQPCPSWSSRPST